MPISRSCKNCGRLYRVGDELAGKAGKCKACGQRFMVSSISEKASGPPARSGSVSVPEISRARGSGWMIAVVVGALGVLAIVPVLRPGTTGVANAAVPRPAPPPPAPPADAPKAPAEPARAVAPAPAVGLIRTFEGHTAEVTRVAYSPDGRRAASASNDRTVRIWDIATGKEVRKLEGHTADVSGVAFTPDGRVVSCGNDKTIRVWDAQSGRELKRLEGHTEGVKHVACSSDGRHAATGSWDHTVRIWDLDAGREVHRLDGHAEVIIGVAYSPDGRRIASGSWDRTVRIWDAALGQEIRKLEGHPDRVGDVAYSADGRYVLSAGDASLRLWEVETGRDVVRIDAGGEPSWAVALARDGRRVLCPKGRDVALRDLATGEETHVFQGHGAQVSAVAFAPDGRTALSGSHDRTVRLWALPPAPSGPSVPSAPASSTGPSPAPAPIPKGQELARAHALREQIDHERDEGKQKALAPLFNAALRAAATAEFAEIAVGTEARPTAFTKVVLHRKGQGIDGVRFKVPAGAPAWDMHWEFVIPSAGNEQGRMAKGWFIVPMQGEMRGFVDYDTRRNETIPGVDLERNIHVTQNMWGGQLRPGREYALWFSYEAGTGEVPTYIKVKLRPAAREIVARIKASEAAQVQRFDLPDVPSGLGRSADGRLALIAAGDSLYSGETASGWVRKLWSGPAGSVRTGAFSSDGKLAALGCADGKILIVDVDSGRQRRVCEGHAGTLRCVAFAPDGRTLASGSEDRTARLWEVATGKELRRFEGHTDQVLCLAVAPDGGRLVTGPSVEDKVARVWDTASGKLLARLEGNAEAVYALAFAPDGKTILTGGEDDTIRLFEARTGRQLGTFQKDGGDNVHALAFLPDGRRAVSGDEGILLRVWSVTSGKALAEYEGPIWGTHLIAVARDGTIFTGNGDATVRVLKLKAR